MKKAYYVELSHPVAEALWRLAWREERDPRRQAARLIEAALRQEGLLPEADATAASAPAARPAALAGAAGPR